MDITQAFPLIAFATRITIVFSGRDGREHDVTFTGDDVARRAQRALGELASRGIERAAVEVSYRHGAHIERATVTVSP